MNMAGAGMSQVAQIDIGGPYIVDTKKLPNKKISLDIHAANGGYVVRVNQGHGNEDEMYVITDDSDIGQELGKIVTHHTLSKS